MKAAPGNHVAWELGGPHERLGQLLCTSGRQRPRKLSESAWQEEGMHLRGRGKGAGPGAGGRCKSLRP